MAKVIRFVAEGMRKAPGPFAATCVCIYY